MNLTYILRIVGHIRAPEFQPGTVPKEFSRNFETVVTLLANGKALPAKYKDHALVSDMTVLHDCHIENDWALLYMRQDDILVLTLVRTGTHSDLGL